MKHNQAHEIAFIGLLGMSLIELMCAQTSSQMMQKLTCAASTYLKIKYLQYLTEKDCRMTQVNFFNFFFVTNKCYPTCSVLSFVRRKMKFDKIDMLQMPRPEPLMKQ